jgi:hypothetical protein
LVQGDLNRRALKGYCDAGRIGVVVIGATMAVRKSSFVSLGEMMRQGRALLSQRREWDRASPARLCPGVASALPFSLLAIELGRGHWFEQKPVIFRRAGIAKRVRSSLPQMASR